MTALVAGQDPAGAVAVAARLGGRAASVTVDGALAPLGESEVGGEAEVAVYVLDAGVPADAVDAAAVSRLRRRLPTVLVATGADVYPDAADTIAASARRLDAAVISVQPDSGGGFDDLAAALEHPAPAPPADPPVGPAPSNPALERADRTAYLRATIARLRAGLLAASAEGFRRPDDGAVPEGVQDRLATVAHDLEQRLGRSLRQAYRGTFAGWTDPPEPATPVLPRPGALDGARPRRRPEDAAVLVLGASAGLGIGRAVAAPLEALGAVRWLALPISLAVGIAAAVWLLRVRRRSTARAEGRSRADAATAAFRQRVEFELSAALVAAEADAALRIARGPGSGRMGTDRGAGASNGYGP